MAYASGTCTDFIDFLRKFRDYAAGLIDPATDPEITSGVKVADVSASGTLTTTANFSNGDTVTVGATTYTFQTALVNAANNVLIGASAQASLANLVAAITAGAGSGTDYGTGTTANASATATSGTSTLTATAITSGVGGNSVSTSAVSTAASWTSPTLTGGVSNVWSIPPLGAGMTPLPATGSATDGECYLVGPGSSGTDQIVVGFQTYRNVGNGIYGIRIIGASAYDSTLTFNTMTGSSPHAHAAFADVSFNCWFWVNNRRLIAAARLGTIDVIIYAGYFLQFGTSSQYPYPLLVSGSVNDDTYTYQTNNFGQSCIPDPCLNSCYLRWVDGNWQSIAAYDQSSSTRNQSSTTSLYSIWPHRDSSVSDGNDPNIDYNEDSLFSSFSGNSSNGQISSSEVNAYPMWPGVLHSNTSLIGTLDGLYTIPGLGLTPGDTVTDQNGVEYDIFHNTWRTESVDWIAIERV